MTLTIEQTATSKLEETMTRIKSEKFPSRNDLNLLFCIETELELRK